MSDLVTAARNLADLIEGQAAVGLILDNTLRAARDVRLILNGTASVRAEAVIVEPNAMREAIALLSEPSPQTHVSGRWLPIDQADKTITDVQDFPEVSMTIRTSDRYWVRDEDGRTYEAAWSEGNNGREYWWDFEGESPVDPVEFMPHPLDPRFTVAEGKDNG